MLIELGEDWSVPDRREPVRTRPRSVRVLPAAAVVAIVLLLLGGAARVEPGLRPLAELPITDSTALAFAPDAAYLGDPASGPVADRTVRGRAMLGVVSAYPLPGRAPRWRTPVAQPPQRLQVVPDAGVVVATTVYGPDSLMLTVALDAATGRQLWTAGNGILVDAPGGGQGLLAAGRGGTAQWVDLHTGRKIWSHPVPPDGTIRLADRATLADPALLLVITPDGAVDVLAERTGALVAAGNVGVLDATDGQLGLPDDRAAPSLDALAGVLLVFRPRLLSAGTVTAYDLRTLSPLWTSSGAYRGYATGCGALICLPTGPGLTGVDPATGRPVWQDSGWDDSRALDGGRVLVAGQATAEMAVLDTVTGRVAVRLPGWAVIDDPGTGLPALVTRPSVAGTGGAFFATLDPGHTGPGLLGDLPHTALHHCRAAAGLLACDSTRRTLQIWRYRT